MASIKEIAEIAYNQIFPNADDETPIDRDEFVSTAKTRYAYEMWRISKEEKRQEGEFAVPSHLLSEDVLDIINNAADISHLNPLTALTDDQWIQSIGGIMCDCNYVRTTVALNKALCDDDSIGDDARTYLLVGKKMIFPRGAHTNRLPIVYVNDGSSTDDDVEVDDHIGSLIGDYLLIRYAGKLGRQDETNNSSSIENKQ